MESLRAVLPARIAYNRPHDVVLLQELQMARIASASMSVGALWFSPDAGRVADPTLVRPFELLGAGHPFLKRSLLTKHARFQQRARVLDALRDLEHPDPDAPAG
jgi:hypothetical protein